MDCNTSKKVQNPDRSRDAADAPRQIFRLHIISNRCLACSGKEFHIQKNLCGGYL